MRVGGYIYTAQDNGSSGFPPFPIAVKAIAFDNGFSRKSFS
jgi:hypothetical protein